MHPWSRVRHVGFYKVEAGRPYRQIVRAPELPILPIDHNCVPHCIHLVHLCEMKGAMLVNRLAHH